MAEAIHSFLGTKRELLPTLAGNQDANVDQQPHMGWLTAKASGVFWCKVAFAL